MDKKIGPTRQGRSNVQNNSITAQQQRLEIALRQYPSVTTLYARKEF